MFTAAHQTAKFQVRTEAGELISASDSRNGIDAFLDRFANGTPRADYEVLATGRNRLGNLIYTVRAAA